MVKISDNKSISETMHQYGINIRYLGHLIGQIDKNNHLNIFLLLEKALIVRCLKHILRETIREYKESNLALVISHFLNCIFGNQTLRQKMEKDPFSIYKTTTQENQQ